MSQTRFDSRNDGLITTMIFSYIYMRRMPSLNMAAIKSKNKLLETSDRILKCLHFFGHLRYHVTETHTGCLQNVKTLNNTATVVKYT